MGGEIIRTGQLPPVEQLIESITDPLSAKEAVSNVEKLKKALDLADRYAEYACRFCKLEAEMLVRIAGIKDADELLSKSTRELVAWIRSKTQSELCAIMEKVETGVRIGYIKRAETRKETARSVTDEYKRISEHILSELDTDGRTTLTPARFYEEWALPVNPDKLAVRSYVESTRDRAIRKKAVGLGDTMGTYILAEKCERTDVADAVSNRLRRINADLRKLHDLCIATGYAVPRSATEILHESVRALEEGC